MCRAAKSGHLNVTLAILKANPALELVNAIAGDGRTSLFYAARAEHWNVTLALLMAGADVGVQREGGFSVLHSAAGAATAQDEVVTALLTAGADPNLRSGDGRAPLFMAAYSGHPGVIRALVTGGADVHLALPETEEASGGETPMFFAAMKGHPEAVQALLDAGANPATLNKAQATPLHQTAAWPCDTGTANDAHEGHIAVVTLLLSAGTECNQQAGDEKWTALHVAAKNGNHLVGVELIMAGCDPGLLDSDGNTAIDLAEIEGFDGPYDFATIVQAAIEGKFTGEMAASIGGAAAEDEDEIAKIVIEKDDL